MSAIKTSTVRSLILGAALGGAAAIALSAPAHADDGTQPPGGVLGAVVEVVDEVLPEPSKPPAKPETEPAPAAEPESSGDQAPASAEPPAAEPVVVVPAVEVPVDVPPVVVDLPPVVVDVPPLVVDVPPVVVVVPPVAVVPPVVVPTPTAPTTTAPATTVTTDAGDTTTVTAPLDDTAVEPAEPATDVEPEPDDLPVPIGPAIGRTLDDGIHYTAPDRHKPATVRDCDDDTRSLDDIRRAIRAAATPDTPAPDRASGGPRQPCPDGPPGPVVHAGTLAAVPGGSSHHIDQASADTTTSVTWPALGRLHQLRARGDLPASRDEQIEPGPA
ncbi:hypothetical protein ABZ388_06620 [Micromonospora parva]|uniref:hypothetical protein n=1 Tax=Micromonospora parva TaxID=1464048 RepID=UPI0033DE9E13